MAFGNGTTDPVEICAYLKRASGWATTTDFTSSDSFVAYTSAVPGTNFNQFYRYVNPNKPAEYFLAEGRYATNRDVMVPANGIIVWHVDEAGDNTLQTSQDTYPEAWVVEADNAQDLKNLIDYGDATDAFYLGNASSVYKNIFNDTSKPADTWWNGAPAGMTLAYFTAAAPSMMFIVGTNNPFPTNIVIAPTNEFAIVGGTAAFQFVSCDGVGPLTYQWLHAGASIAGATTTSLVITNLRTTDAGAYSLIVSNVFGSAASATATLRVIATVPLNYALNNSNLTWSTSTSNFWYGQASVSHDGVASAQSWPIGNSQQTSFSASPTGPGSVSFWWKVSSQTNADILSVSLNGSVLASISGQVNWQSKVIYLDSGPNLLQWTYAKDATGSSGQDAGWVDQVTYMTGGTPPYIVSPPTDQTAFYHAPVSLSVTAAGTPTLHYQWFFNGKILAGATLSTYSIVSATPDKAGAYSVQINNSYGITNSASANVAVIPVMAVGNNLLQQAVVSPAAAAAVAVAAGDYHSLALTAGGSVAAWGDDYNAQCDVPAGLAGVMGVAAGGYHSLALKLDGTMVGWGANDVGQLNIPAAATNLVAIAAGESHSLALRADGRVLVWGDNSAGQLGLPANLTNIVAIAAGGNHSLALRADGTVAAWGDNFDAYGDYVGQSSVPWGLSNVVAIAAGQFHSLALLRNGSVVAWGDDSAGQSVPPSLTNAVSVAGGSLYSLALKADGTVLGWGDDSDGQYDFPTNLPTVLSVAAGSAHTLVRVGAAPTAPTIVSPSLNATQFAMIVETVAGKHYSLQYKTTLANVPWTTVTNLNGSVYGTGSPQFLLDGAANTGPRFYRVVQW